VQRLARTGLIGLEIAILTAIVLVTRCTNHRDVFVAGNVYFTDADCYARMTRVRICAEHPGLIVRHHDFENYPAGTTPHTTAPLDYLILALSFPFRPFTAQAIDLAGALISPVFALLTGWFLWWWLRHMRWRYRWTALILYLASPILVHGTELGRPDHQSLLMLFVAVGICAEWGWQADARPGWSVLSGIAWSLAIWISAYEPLLLLLLLVWCDAVTWLGPGFGLFRRDRSGNGRHVSLFFSKQRRTGLIAFIIVTALAFLIERRIPTFAIFSSSAIFRNWSHTIGELRPVPPLSPLWLHWAGYAVLIIPVLLCLNFWKGDRGQAVSSGATSFAGDRYSAKIPLFMLVFLVATYGLTIWQARWGYFFMTAFVIVLPAVPQWIKSSVLVWMAFLVSMFPILREWDEKLWPNESEVSRRVESRNDSMQLRELSLGLRSPEVDPFLAPWWLSPAIAYWSGQPGVAGSSHESLDGIADSARFFLAEDFQKSREIVKNHQVSWVFAYDADRVALISAIILDQRPVEHALCYVLQRAPNQAPRFLVFSAQNTSAKLFRVVAVPNNR
jgi:hypothetical protein